LSVQRFFYIFPTFSINKNAGNSSSYVNKQLKESVSLMYDVEQNNG